MCKEERIGPGLRIGGASLLTVGRLDLCEKTWSQSEPLPLPSVLLGPVGRTNQVLAGPGRQVTLTISHPNVGDCHFQPMLEYALSEWIAKGQGGVEPYEYHARNGVTIRASFPTRSGP